MDIIKDVSKKIGFKFNQENKHGVNQEDKPQEKIEFPFADWKGKVKVKPSSLEDLTTFRKDRRNRRLSSDSKIRSDESSASCTLCVICDNEVIACVSTCIDQHLCCKDCIIKYVGEQVQENPNELPCPESNCKKVMGPRRFEKWITDERVVEHLRDVRAEMEALAIQKRLSCPYYSCGKSFLDDRKQERKIACPHCWRKICAECWVPYHEGSCYRKYHYSGYRSSSLSWSNGPWN